MIAVKWRIQHQALQRSHTRRGYVAQPGLKVTAGHIRHNHFFRDALRLVNRNGVTHDQGKLGASAECRSNQEVSVYWQNRHNLPAVRGGQECRSGVLAKLHHDSTRLVSEGVSPRRPANVVHCATSAVTETNLLPQVARQHQTGTDAHRNMLRKVTRLVVGCSRRADADIPRRDLDDRSGRAVEVVMVIFVHPFFRGIYSQGVGKPRNRSSSFACTRPESSFQDSLDSWCSRNSSRTVRNASWSSPR